MSRITNDMHDYVHLLQDVAYGGLPVEDRTSKLLTRFIVTAQWDLGRWRYFRP
jgi:hypothetical protein